MMCVQYTIFTPSFSMLKLAENNDFRPFARKRDFGRKPRTLQILAMVVVDMDLEGFLARIETAEATGPVLDPTLYREAGEKLADVQALAEACKVFRDEVRRQAADKGEAKGNEDKVVRP
jgi:hypothetical protein